MENPTQQTEETDRAAEAKRLREARREARKRNIERNSAARLRRIQGGGAYSDTKSSVSESHVEEYSEVTNADVYTVDVGKESTATLSEHSDARYGPTTASHTAQSTRDGRCASNATSMAREGNDPSLPVASLYSEQGSVLSRVTSSGCSLESRCEKPAAFVAENDANGGDGDVCDGGDDEILQLAGDQCDIAPADYAEDGDDSITQFASLNMVSLSVLLVL